MALTRLSAADAFAAEASREALFGNRSLDTDAARSGLDGIADHLAADASIRSDVGGAAAGCAPPGKLEAGEPQDEQTMPAQLRIGRERTSMADRSDDMVQAIVERNRKEAKQAEERSTAIGAAIAAGAFEIVVALGIVHVPPSGGINLNRLGGAALCGALGAAIGKWLGRPRSARSSRSR